MGLDFGNKVPLGFLIAQNSFCVMCDWASHKKNYMCLYVLEFLEFLVFFKAGGELLFPPGMLYWFCIIFLMRDKTTNLLDPFRIILFAILGMWSVPKHRQRHQSKRKKYFDGDPCRFSLLLIIPNCGGTLAKAYVTFVFVDHRY